MKKMEQPKNPEILRQKIERAIEELAKAEGMSAEDIDSDIITFAPVEENEEFSNPEYFEILAEQLNMRLGNILNYAQTKYAEHHSEDE